MTTPPFPPVSDADLAVMREQLGRPARGVVGIAARCVCGNPTVAATAPRLPDGTPFPTFYYLTHPAATAAMSVLEADHVMRELQDSLAEDDGLRAAYARAHEAYLSDRAQFGDVGEIAGISAGGMPTRVKCLHALAAHALAAGPGVNPIGDRALELSAWSPSRCSCAVPGAAGDSAARAGSGSSARAASDAAGSADADSAARAASDPSPGAEGAG